MYVAAIPLEDIVRVSFIGSFARLAGVVLIGSAFFALIGGALRIRRTDSAILIFAAFVAWSVLSYFWSGNRDQTVVRIATDVQLLLATLILWQQVSTKWRLEVVLRAYIVGTFIASIYGIVTRQSTDETGVQRYAIGGPNSFGVQVVFAMLAAYWLLNQPNINVRWKRFYAAFLVVGVVAVFATASRTALLALGFAIVIAVADRRLLRPRNAPGVLAIGGSATYAVMRFVSARQLERLGTVTEAASSGLNGRTTLWGIALDVVHTHPIEGLGAAVFRDYSDAVIGVSQVAHNSFLGVAADLGVVGLVLFVATFVVAAKGLIGLPPITRKIWFGLVGVWFIGASTLTWENQKFTFLVLVLVAAKSSWVTSSEPARRLMSTAQQD